jgi:orotate phosphoribosyltransferase
MVAIAGLPYVMMADEYRRRMIAHQLVVAGVPGVNFKTLTTFKSKIKSPYYMDCRKIAGTPSAWEAVVDSFTLALTGQYDAVAGIQTGAIPLSSAFAYAERPLVTHGGPLPHYGIKKAEKDHGLKGRIDGGDPSGKRVVIIEDVITTNGSLWDGVEVMRAAGATVVACAAVVSYDLRGANQKFEDEKIPLRLLTTLPDILYAMECAGKLSIQDKIRVLEWHADPEHWHEKNQSK